MEKLSVVIIGYGNIAGPYAQDLVAYPEIELAGVAGPDFQKAQNFAAEHDCRAYPSVGAVLEDPSVELVVNLTAHHAHEDITSQCLEADKHVYSEKPLAMSYENARGLVDFAESRGLLLGSSPCTFMGEAQQTASKWLAEGWLGTVRLVYAEANWGRVESRHPAPEPFYRVGPLYDVGVYPLTLLTNIFGPAVQVWAYGKVLYPDRTTKEGVPFLVETPEFVVAAVELLDGTVVRLTTNFYAALNSKQSGVEFHGDLGSLYLSSWQSFDATVEFAEFGESYAPMPLVKEPYKGTEWGRGVLDMAEALAEPRSHRATGEQAAHVVEILGAISGSLKLNKPVRIHSSFTPPLPMSWAT